MTRAVVAVLALVMVAACAASSEPKSSPSGRCLYAVEGIEFGRMLAEIAADKDRTYEYLLRVSMIASLRRAEELG